MTCHATWYGTVGVSWLALVIMGAAPENDEATALQTTQNLYKAIARQTTATTQQTTVTTQQTTLNLDRATTQQAALNVVVDFSKSLGKIRPLHGVVNGPLDWDDVSVFHKEAGFPYTQLNAPHFNTMDVVDIHCIFPGYDADDADPDDPQSYFFAKTDRYVQSVLNTGAKIVYRLGESPGWCLGPPKDFDKWARICVNIIRHYNEGWANGFRYNIQYWQIWNEPEMAGQWRGTQEQYLDLYRVAATAIKAHDPSLKVGGPAAFAEVSLLVRPFLAYCRDRKLPLDFFSWHRYVAVPRTVVEAVTRVRTILDEYGFKNTENHLTEWHYMKNNGADLHAKDCRDYPKVRAAYNDLVGPEGAAFCASLLMLLQDSPVDKAFHYTADTYRYGMFDHFGVPHKMYYSFRAFNELMKTPNRVECQGLPKDDGMTLCAGLAEDGKSAALMISSFRGPQRQVERQVAVSLRNLSWTGPIQVQIYAVDDKHDFEIIRQDKVDAKEMTLNLDLAAPSVRYVFLSRL